jgi:hypothetical protein
VYYTYFDESADQFQKKILCVGGFVGRWEEWAKIEWRWKALLDEYEIDYYRASEAEHARGQFGKPPFRTDRKSLTYQQNEMLRNVQKRFRDLMVNGSRISGLAVGVPIEDFSAVTRDPEKLIRLGSTPYYICGHMAMIVALDGIMTDLRYKDVVAFIFDQQEEFEHDMLRVHSTLLQAPSDFRAQLGTLSFQDKRRFIPLQIADTLVYEVRKDFETRLNNPNVPERPALSELKHKHKIFRISLCGQECLEWVLTQPEIRLTARVT